MEYMIVDMEEAMDMDLATLYTVPDVEYPLVTNGRVMLMQSGDVRRTSTSDPSVVFVDDNAPAQDYYINTEQHTYNSTSFAFQNDKINATFYNGFGGGVAEGEGTAMDDDDIVREFIDLDTPLVTESGACAQAQQSQSTLLYGDENCFGGLRRGDSWLENSCTIPDNDANAVGNIVEEIRTAAAVIEQQRHSPSISPKTSYMWNSEDDNSSLDSIDFGTLINMDNYSSEQSDSDSEYESSNSTKKRTATYKRQGGSRIEDRRERKKAQNRAAAIRYRQKKMFEKDDKNELLTSLSTRNRELKRIVKNVAFEVDFMKRLIAEKKQVASF